MPVFRDFWTRAIHLPVHKLLIQLFLSFGMAGMRAELLLEFLLVLELLAHDSVSHDLGCVLLQLFLGRHSSWHVGEEVWQANVAVLLRCRRERISNHSVQVDMATSRCVREELRNRLELWLLIAAAPEWVGVSHRSLDFSDGFNLCCGVDPVQEVQILLVTVLDLPHVKERIDVASFVAF